MENKQIYSNPIWDQFQLKVDKTSVEWNGITLTIPENLKSKGWVQKHEVSQPHEFNFGNIAGACLLIETTCTMFKKHINRRHNSYGLKHIIEANEYYQDFSKSTYLSNGELIFAMLLNGYTFYSINGLNCYFNILESDVEHLKKHNPYRNH